MLYFSRHFLEKKQVDCVIYVCFELMYIPKEFVQNCIIISYFNKQIYLIFKWTLYFPTFPERWQGQLMFSLIPKVWSSSSKHWALCLQQVSRGRSRVAARRGSVGI